MDGSHTLLQPPPADLRIGGYCEESRLLWLGLWAGLDWSVLLLCNLVTEGHEGIALHHWHLEYHSNTEGCVKVHLQAACQLLNSVAASRRYMENHVLFLLQVGL